MELTKEETATLETYEGIIEQGLANFIEVGTALARIRDAELYRKTHTTFEAYVKDRWKFGKSYAYRLIFAAEFAESPIGDKPKSEGQVRPLLTLPEEERAEAWQEAVASSNGTPTAKDVEAVVERRKPTAAKPGPSADEVTEIEDELDKWQDFIDDRWANGVLQKRAFMKVVFQAVAYAKAKK